MMSLDRAREIVAAINARCFVSMGIDRELPSLEGVSLAEMVRASAMVRTANAATAAAAKFNGTGYTMQVVPADRLIAAVYAIDHYPTSRIPVLTLPRGGNRQRALAVVEIDGVQMEDAE